MLQSKSNLECQGLYGWKFIAKSIENFPLLFNANQYGQYKYIRGCRALSKANKSSTSTSRSSTPNRIPLDAVSFKSFEFSRKSNETTDFVRVNASYWYGRFTTAGRAPRPEQITLNPSRLGKEAETT